MDVLGRTRGGLGILLATLPWWLDVQTTLPTCVSGRKRDGTTWYYMVVGGGWGTLRTDAGRMWLSGCTARVGCRCSA